MKTILLIIGSIVGGIVLIALIMAVIGSRLNPNHVAARSIRLQRSPADVYSVIRDFEHAAAWRSDIKQMEMLGTIDGHLRFREHGSHGTVTYEVLADDPGKRLVTRIVDRDLGYSGSWEYTIAPDGNGASLSIKESGEVSNPLFRFMSRYIFGQTATIDNYLKSLAKHFGETAEPQPMFPPT